MKTEVSTREFWKLTFKTGEDSASALYAKDAYTPLEMLKTVESLCESGLVLESLTSTAA
jgi:hypothetical protein